MSTIKNVSTTGYQFAHMDWTARSGGKVKGIFRTRTGEQFRTTGWKPFDLLAEAKRLPGHHAHVANPQPPVYLYGHEDTLKVEDDVHAWLAHREEVDGRKYAINRPVMTNAVISFPGNRLEEWDAYRDRLVDWLKHKYGGALRCIVEHQDEGSPVIHPHIHIYCVPQFGRDAAGKAWAHDFATIHQGYAARNAERRRNAQEKGGDWLASGARAGTAFIKAMESWQDEIYCEVSRFFGLARKGPALVRLPYKIAVAQAQQRLQIASDLIAAEECERNGREAERRAQAELLNAEQVRHDAERYTVEIMAIRDKVQADFAAWKRLQQTEFDRREKALSEDTARLAEAERLAAEGQMKTNKQIFLLHNANRKLDANNKALRAQLAEIKSDIVTVLSHFDNAALGRLGGIYEKYLLKGEEDINNIIDIERDGNLPATPLPSRSHAAGNGGNFSSDRKEGHL